MSRKLALILLIVAIAIPLIAQQAATPKVKKVPATYTSPASGQEMYVSYCASCHGKDGKGKGPAAPAMKAPPTDLTLLAKKNNGGFPTDRFASVLTGKQAISAHGSEDMPVWGPIFWKLSQSHPAEVQQRIYNLDKYVQSLQQR